MDPRFPALVPQIRMENRPLALNALPLGEWLVFSVWILLLIWA